MISFANGNIYHRSHYKHMINKEESIEIAPDNLSNYRKCNTCQSLLINSSISKLMLNLFYLMYELQLS